MMAQFIFHPADKQLGRITVNALMAVEKMLDQALGIADLMDIDRFRALLGEWLAREYDISEELAGEALKAWATHGIETGKGSPAGRQAWTLALAEDDVTVESLSKDRECKALPVKRGGPFR